MKILHVFANWKWTGPAEPALALARQQRDAGLDVTFACARPPDEDGYGLANKVEEAGLTALFDLTLNKHFNVLDNSRDVKSLTRMIKRSGFDILHAHTANDHFVGGAAAKLRGSGPKVVRTSYDGKGQPDTFRNRFLLNRLTDGYIASSLAAYDADQAVFEMAGVRSKKISPSVDCKAFHPGLRSQSLRSEFGISPDEVCVGIVARMQRHRRFDVLLNAAARVLAEGLPMRLVIIGRGTHAEEVVRRPARALGLSDALILTGYRYEDYPRTLAMLDAKVFLVPGSDGTCRAVRQALACGIPVIAADRGMLMEIVEHGRSGLVIEDSEDNLFWAIRRLVADGEERRAMGRAARDRAERLFSLEEHEQQVRLLYTEILESHE